MRAAGSAVHALAFVGLLASGGMASWLRGREALGAALVERQEGQLGDPRDGKLGWLLFAKAVANDRVLTNRIESMESTAIGLMVLGTLAGVILTTAAIWIPVLHHARRLPKLLREELASIGEQLVRGPESAQYRGGTGGFPRVKGLGAIALTRKRLLFQRAIGSRRVEIRVTEVVGVREDKWFRGAFRVGAKHLIVKTLAGAEAGFYVSDLEGWKASLRHVTGKRGNGQPAAP